MPLYEYHCDDCDKNIEVLVRASENPTCDDCGSSKLTRLLSVPAAHTTGGSSLPVCEAPGPMPPPCGMGGCGRPDCG